MGMGVYDGTAGCGALVFTADSDPNTLNLTGLTTGTTYYVRVYGWFSSIQYNDFDICLGTPVPTCGDPSVQTAMNITSTTADLGWTAGADAETMWDVEWGLVGFVVENGEEVGMVMGTMDNPYTATGLTATTDYEFYVRAGCSATLHSNWVGPFAFTTIAPQPPVNDLCASATALTVGTSIMDNVVSGTNILATDSGEIAAGCASYAGGDIWYSAVVPASGEINVQTSSATGGDGGLAIYSGVCGTLTELACSDDEGPGLYGFIQLTGLNPGDTLLIRVWEFGNNADINFDIVAFSPTCHPPSALAANNVTINTADLAWTPGADAETMWDVEWGAAGFTQGAGTMIMGTTNNPEMLTGLASGTNFEFYVRAGCSSTDHSDWVGPFAFATVAELPANDLAVDAIAVACGDTVTGNTSAATIDPQGDCGSVDNDAPNVFYTFTGTGTAESVTLSLCGSSYDTSIAVFTGTPGALVCLANNDDSAACAPAGTRSQVTFTSDGTQTYYIMIEGWNATSVGAYEMVVSCEAACTPAVTNQDCASALGLVIDDPAVTSDNTCATININNTGCDPFGVIADVWFSFVAPANGLVNVTTVLGSATEVNLVAYSGACGTLTEINCIDTVDTANALNLNGLVAGDTYYIQAWNDGTNTMQEGTFDIALTGVSVMVADCPTMTFPADGATEVSYPLVLTWDAALTGDPADSYNVYVSVNGGAEVLLGNYTATETQSINLLNPDLSIIWRVVPVNAAGENIACTTTFTFTTFVGTDDTDGDGIDNLTERDATPQSDMNDPCDPVQAAGYTGYDATNAIWAAADCDGDGDLNGAEDTAGSDPYDASSTVSVDDLEAVGFNYYPNPVSKDLHLTARENITNVSIFNMLGQEVKSIAPSSLETTINMSNLANGTYFVKAQVGDAVGTFKVVKK